MAAVEGRMFAATATPQSEPGKPANQAEHDKEGQEGDDERANYTAASSVSNPVSVKERGRKLGHRRVDESGVVTYKKKPTSELQEAIQLGIGQSIGGLSHKPERDVLMQDFAVVEVAFYPSEGSNLTPAHRCSDFRFKTYAPVAFRYFRDLFGIQPEDFMVSLCADPLTELSNPGASGSIFYCTNDDEFIIKTVQHKEADFLQKLLPGYFLNISQNKRTLLPKFYGLYCYQCGGKNIRFVVMNNLLPSAVRLHEKYDLKGSTYKRKASKRERAKSSPTLKDLDFLDLHQEGLMLERDTYEALIKTLQRDCRVLESFKIMDYSLLVGVYNLDQAAREKGDSGDFTTRPEKSSGGSGPSAAGSSKPGGSTSLSRGKSFKTRLGQYSTPMESIQANSVDKTLDDDVPPGGIPAKNSKGEQLLLYLGIIDILQSFRLKKRLEHTMKAVITDGDSVSVHRPSFYAQRFLNFMATRVFKKMPSALKHSPSKKKSAAGRTRTQTLNEEVKGQVVRVRERTARTVSFSDEQGAIGGRPDLLPDSVKSLPQSPLVAATSTQPSPVTSATQSSTVMSATQSLMSTSATQSSAMTSAAQLSAVTSATQSLAVASAAQLSDVTSATQSSAVTSTTHSSAVTPAAQSPMVADTIQLQSSSEPSTH